MNEEKEEKKKKIKGILIRSILSFAFASILFTIVLLIELYALNLSWLTNKYRILSDSFFVGGCLPILFFLLVWVSEKGAFDLITYSVRKLFSYCFRIHPEKSNLPPTYGDYVEMKKAKRKPFHYELIVMGSLFLILGVVFALLSIGVE